MKRRLMSLLGFAFAVAACKPDLPVGPTIEDGLDAQLRQSFGRWGVVPIGDVAAQPPAVVALGRMLMFDKILSGNRDISCATCHHPSTSGGDGLALSIGTGGTGLGRSRTLGVGRRFVPRNAPSLLDQGLRSSVIFWDGRVGGFRTGPFDTPAKKALPTDITNILTAQAMFPVTNREEMRGDVGDHDVFGNSNELALIADTLYAAIWQGVMQRLVVIPEYVTLFNAAFPGVPVSALGFQHAATAIAAFETEAFTRTHTPFDRYLEQDNSALSAPEKRGGILFFARAGCARCHGGPLLGGSTFANTGVPQIGPGVGAAVPLDRGRSVAPGDTLPANRFRFRAPPLRNVELTAPYMHNGAFSTLDAVLLHYNDATAALRSFDPSTLASEVRALYHGDDATTAAVLASLDFGLRNALGLSADQRTDLVAFLKSLTDPAARDLSALAPERVPSGLPIDQ